MGKLEDRLRRIDERAFRMDKRRSRLGAVASDDEAWTRHVTRQWRWMLSVASALTLAAIASALGHLVSGVPMMPAAVALAFAAGGYRAEEMRMRGLPMREQAIRLAAASSALPAAGVARAATRVD